MKQEFLELLETNYDEKYLEIVEKKGLNKEYNIIRNSFSANNSNDRELILRDIFSKGADESKLKKLANPFYIGFGNPNSNLLIIGKEKAFQVENADLLIKESINNFYQWKQMVTLNLFNANQKDFKDRFGFSPLLPKAYHDRSIPRKHTWGIISLIIASIFNSENWKSIDESTYIKKSIFNECFLTELNHIPSRYNEGTGLTKTRKEFLKHQFYKSFPNVIIGAKSYLNKNSNAILKEIFGAEYVEDIFLGFIGTKRKRQIVTHKFESKNQKIYVCDQLSGASGWTNEAILNLGNEITGRNAYIE